MNEKEIIAELKELLKEAKEQKNIELALQVLDRIQVYDQQGKAAKP